MRLDPKTFWAMTPLELAIVAGLHGNGRPAPDRQGLDTLMRAFPDGAIATPRPPGG